MKMKFSKKQKTVLILLSVFAIPILIFGMISDGFGTDTTLSSFFRPESYEEDREISFMVEVPEGEAFFYEGEVGARTLSEREAEEEIEKAFKRVEHFLKEGEGKRRETIFLPRRISESPVQIDFETNAPETVLPDGRIDYTKVKEMKRVTIHVTISYGKKEETRNFQISLIPLPVAEEEKLRAEIKERLDFVLQGDGKKEVLLPEAIGGTKLRYFKPKERLAPKLAGSVFCFFLLIVGLFKAENDKKKDTRERELGEAYAYFAGRFVILLGAGLNPVSIWRKLSQKENFNRSLSEEIGITVREIENGKTEREAYENFGRRIGGLQYTKFASILSENLRTGSGQLLKRLGEEAEGAMAERRNRAKMLGETAGTKLLMPMMAELGLILALILIPSMILI